MERKSEINLLEMLKTTLALSFALVGSFMVALVTASAAIPTENSMAAEIEESIDDHSVSNTYMNFSYNYSLEMTGYGDVETSDTILAKTNSRKGYTLSVSMNDSKLYLDGDSSKAYIAPVGGETPATIDSPTTLGTNQWGIRLASTNASTSDYWVPSSAGTDIKTTESANSTKVDGVSIVGIDSSQLNADEINIVTHAKTGSSAMAGIYSNRIVYTMTANTVSYHYVVNFDANAGSDTVTNMPSSPLTYSGTSLTHDFSLAGVSQPEREGYTFLGWSQSPLYSSEDSFTAYSVQATQLDTDTPVTTLYAIWSENTGLEDGSEIDGYALVRWKANYDGGTNPAPQLLLVGSTLGTLATAPSRGSNYTFDGWWTASSGGEEVSSSNTIDGNSTFYAHWIGPVNITYDLNYTGAPTISGTTVAYNTAIGSAAIPTQSRSGYEFDGWYSAATGGTEYTASSTLTEDTIFYAHWKEYHTVTWYLNVPSGASTPTFTCGSGETCSGSGTTYTSSKVEGSTIAHLPTVSDPSGYTFKGWFTASSGGTQISDGTTVSDTTYYWAQYEEISDITGITTMQDANISSACASTAVGTVTTMTDTRDNNSYKVAKLADQKCWMIQNLNLDVAAASSAGKLGNAYTNSSSSSFTYTSVKDAESNYLTTSSSPYNHYVLNTSTNSGYYQYGVATLGSGADISSGTASYDICPKGWRLPTGNTSGEFQALYSAYSSTYANYINGSATNNNTAGAIPGFGLTGLYDAYSSFKGLRDQSSDGYWWSSTLYNATTAYLQYASTSSVYPANDSYKYIGFSVRCVAK